MWARKAGEEHPFALYHLREWLASFPDRLILASRLKIDFFEPDSVYGADEQSAQSLL